MTVIQLNVDSDPTSWAIQERRPAAQTRPPKAPTATTKALPPPAALLRPVGSVVETVMPLPDPLVEPPLATVGTDAPWAHPWNH